MVTLFLELRNLWDDQKSTSGTWILCKFYDNALLNYRLEKIYSSFKLSYVANLRADEDLGIDFGPNERGTDNPENEDAAIRPETETKKEKTRKTIIAENRAILSIIDTPNDDGIGWLDQKDGCVFTCVLCSSVVETFSNVCDHMQNVHPLDQATLEAAKEDPLVATNQCIACPKKFKKRSHLKVIFRRVRAFLGIFITICNRRKHIHIVNLLKCVFISDPSLETS